MAIGILPSWSGHFAFVGIATTFGVGSSGVSLVTLGRAVATGAGVGGVHVPAMHPAIVGVGVFPVGSSLVVVPRGIGHGAVAVLGARN